MEGSGTGICVGKQRVDAIHPRKQDAGRSLGCYHMVRRSGHTVLASFVRLGLGRFARCI